MYNKYFGFSESPFENNLDQRFLFLSNQHREVLAALLYFVKAKKSFAIVCGDVGTGKTMLLTSFLARLPDSVLPVMLSNPYVSSQELLQYLTKTLKVETPGNEGVLDLTDRVKEALLEAHRQGKQVVLIIDEAHLLSDQALEEIRLLSNSEVPEQKLLQILLVGQYELSYKLDRPEMRPLRQRLNVNRFLSPLNSAETLEYIDHRLKQVGSSAASVFESDYHKLIFKMTNGLPRLINQICDSSLLICRAEGLKKVNRKILKEAEEAVHTDQVFTPKFYKGSGPRRGRFPILRWTALAASALFIIGLIAFNVFVMVKNFPQPSAKSLVVAEIPPGPKTSSGELIEGGPNPQSVKPESMAAREVPTAKPQAPVPPTLTPSATTKDEGLGKPDELGQRVSQPSEPAKISSPQREAPAPKQGPLSESTQITAKAGEGLIRIASQHYPENIKLGLDAIILANPKITNEDLIYPGQVLSLPSINFSKQMIQLDDNLFYAILDRSRSPEDQEKIAAWLTRSKVKFQVRETEVAGGKAIRIFLGGYDTEDDLAKTQGSLKAREMNQGGSS